MVFNRLCDPGSKLGVLRWLETVASLPRLQLRGIMCIPEPAPDFAGRLRSIQKSQ